MLKENYYIEPTDVDQLVFDKLIPPDHYLRRVKQLIDFESFRELVKDCYSPTMGRGAEDPVRLIKLEFLQFHYTLSDREVIAEARVNVAFRLFLDLSLDSRLPVASLLSQFRTRLGAERHRALFDHVVGQAREHGLVGNRLRLKDATHVIANIAVPSTLGLVAHVRQRLLDGARPYAPQRAAEEEAEAERLRQGTSDLKDVERLAHRVAHLRTIVSWADALQHAPGPLASEPEPVRARFEAALALAHQVLADRDAPERGDQVRSAVDADARRGKHGEYFDGYLLDILVDADSELLTALEVLPGNGDEARDAPALLGAEVQAQGETAHALSIDGIGWNGEVLRDLSDPQGLAMEVYVPPSPQVNDEGRFGPEAFSLDDGGQVLRCPAGEQTSRKERNTNNTGWKFIFARGLCAACPLQADCVPTLPKAKGRSVIKNDYQHEYDAARQRATTDDYAEVRQQHPRVERKLADIVRYHGGRRSRYRGRGRVKVQYLLTGMVVNIKRMVKLLCPQVPQYAPQAV
jgi:transposase